MRQYDFAAKALSVLRTVNEDDWTAQGHAEWSLNGKRIAMFGGVGPFREIFVTDDKSKNPVRYTALNGYNTDVTWSPDGTRIAWLRNYDPAKDYIEGIGYLGDSAICTANGDGTAQEYLIQDGNINSKPSRSRDGGKIYFHRMEYDPLVEYSFGVFSIEIETNEVKRITNTGTGSNEYPMN